MFLQWFAEPRAYAKDSADRKTVMFVDNCGGHNESPELRAIMDSTNTELRYFRPCATDLVQPADSFSISKINDEWTRQWEAENMRFIRDGGWDTVRSDGVWSGKLKNPGKRFFLELAAKSVHAVNGMRDRFGLTYARKAMIRCGMALDVCGRWHEGQLSMELQEIVKNHRVHFNGTVVAEPQPK